MRRELLSNLFFLQGKAPKKIHAILTETLQEHAPSYPTVKNRVALIKRVHFSTCFAPRPGRPKTVTTPENIVQIHELILEDHRISANWAFHVSGLGPSFMKIWTCGSSPRSGSLNAWTRIKNVNGASRLSQFCNFFGSIQMISCSDWWPWAKLVISLWLGDKATVNGVAA